jgi:hypothetical protein
LAIIASFSIVVRSLQKFEVLYASSGLPRAVQRRSASLRHP